MAIKFSALPAASSVAGTDLTCFSIGTGPATSESVTLALLMRSVPDGTVAAPGLAVGSDQATGLYKVGTGALGISAGGVLVLTGAVQTSGTGATVAITDSTRTGGTGVVQVGVTVAHTLNQTSTAAFTSIDISRVETATGSGTQLLVNGKTGSAGTTSVWSVNNKGVEALAGGLVLPLGATGAGNLALQIGSTAQWGFYGDSTNLYLTQNSAKLCSWNSSVPSTDYWFSWTTRNQVANTKQVYSSWVAANALIGFDFNNSGVAFSGAGSAQVGVSITHTINQTSTSSFTSLRVIQTTTSAGTGTQLLLDLQAGSSPASVHVVTPQGGFGVAVVSPAQLANGNVDNYAGVAGYSLARLTPDSTATVIRGILAPAPAIGMILTLINLGNGAGTLVVNNQDAGSTAANRIQTTTGAATTIATTGIMRLQYDPTSAFWRQI